mmetsp:Transcript_129413/g.251956  ORF Transcript_129413/g.251956 Transcript_129413/m.251956 type:complete len:247 (-) Transcript_129413:340-1080(-)
MCRALCVSICDRRFDESSAPFFGAWVTHGTLAYVRIKSVHVRRTPASTAYRSLPEAMKIAKMKKICPHSNIERYFLEPHKFSATKPDPAKNRRIPKKKRGSRLKCSIVVKKVMPQRAAYTQLPRRSLMLPRIPKLITLNLSCIYPTGDPHSVVNTLPAPKSCISRSLLIFTGSFPSVPNTFKRQSMKQTTSIMIRSGIVFDQAAKFTLPNFAKPAVQAAQNSMFVTVGNIQSGTSDRLEPEAKTIT